MITRTTFRLLTGGAMGTRDLAGFESAPSNAADSTFSNLSKVKSKETLVQRKMSLKVGVDSNAR
jgi:hypothetical protein